MIHERMGFTGGDVVIVGGGPAGLTTALSLARRAPSIRSRIVVLEAATYPREKYCAGAIGGRGEKILDALDALPDVPHVPIAGVSLRVKEGEASARAGHIGRVVRRIEFDDALAKKVRAAGVEIVEATRVTSVEPRAEGARVETSRGAIDAAVVIGADGVGSAVRKAMGLSHGVHRAQVLEIDTESVAHDRDRTLLHFDASDRRYPGYTWDFPTIVDGAPLVCRGIYHLRLADETVDLAALLAERLAATGLDLARYKNKRYSERGYEPTTVFSHGALMLVGEAAGIDPVSGEGIAQAIEYGDLAGRFVADHFADRVPLVEWTGTVRHSRLGRDLGIRTRAIQGFYGAARPRFERFLLRTPDALHLGAQHFGGIRFDRMALARFGVRASIALVAAGIGRALGAGE